MLFVHYAIAKDFFFVSGQRLIIGRPQGTPETDGTHWRRRWGEDSRLIRHVPMDWTTGTPGTAGNDTLAPGDWLADAGDSGKRRLRVRQAICGNLPQSAKKPAA